MTQTEMKDKFDMLYNYMSASNEPRYMKLFGEVMQEMMDWMIKNQSASAEQWIETLCAIKWEQYLTKSEALTVFNAHSSLFSFTLFWVSRINISFSSCVIFLSTMSAFTS